MNNFFKKATGHLKIFAIEWALIAAVLLGSMLGFAFIADEIVVEGSGLFDARVFRAIDSISSSQLTRVALVVTFFGTGFFLIPAWGIIIYYFVRKKRIPEALWVGAVALTSLLLGLLLKELFQRPRPRLPFLEHAGGFSFPSGHSLGGFTFSGVMIYLIRNSGLSSIRKNAFTVFFILFGVLIGLSRVYLHVHFASDVIGSFCVTGVWLSLSLIVVRLFQKKGGNVQPPG